MARIANLMNYSGFISKVKCNKSIKFRFASVFTTDCLSNEKTLIIFLQQDAFFMNSAQI
ncbi:hypothetical protein D3C87_1063980 [compost metagenome]